MLSLFGYCRWYNHNQDGHHYFIMIMTDSAIPQSNFYSMYWPWNPTRTQDLHRIGTANHHTQRHDAHHNADLGIVDGPLSCGF